MFVSVYALYIQVPINTKRTSDDPGARITGSYAVPNVGVGNQIQIH